MTKAVSAVEGVTEVSVVLDVMSDEQRTALRTQLRGNQPEREIPFARPESLTRVYGVASGKGGVGKSSVTVNLAVALARSGLSVGLLDADIYGHSVPRMLGLEDRGPTQVESMLMPPQAYGVKVISTGMFTRGNQPVTWRGPMLHRALQQFLSDVYWGDLDVLLLDLPPGTGDVAISLAQLIPSSEILLVTTPQLAATEVAERAGTIARQTRQNVVGVVENMAYLPCPHCGEQLDVFGSGGGAAVAEQPDRGARPRGAAARSDPARRPAARGRRRGTPAGAHRARLRGGQGAAVDRRPAGLALARAVRPLARADARPSTSRLRRAQVASAS